MLSKSATFVRNLATQRDRQTDRYENTTIFAKVLGPIMQTPLRFLRLYNRIINFPIQNVTLNVFSSLSGILQSIQVLQTF